MYKETVFFPIDMQLLICGGGNGAHVLAGLAAADPDTEVRVLTMFQDEAERWTNSMKDHQFTVTFHHHSEEVRRLTGKPDLVSKDPKVAEGCQLIVLVVPAFSHGQYLKAIKPYIMAGATIVGLPGQAGFEFDVWGILGDKAKDCNLMNFESLPWACRIKEYGVEVQALGTKGELAGALQHGGVKSLIDPIQSLQNILGEHPVLHVKGHILGMTLMGVNAYGHSAILYGKWKDYQKETFETAPLFYQGLDEYAANTMSSMSDEILATAEAIMNKYTDIDLSNVIHIFPFMLKSYSGEIKDKTSLQTAFASNEAYIGLIHPMKQVSPEDSKLVPDFGHRYFTEDIPYGLVVLRGISEVVGVPTPVMDKVLSWAQGHMGKVYLEEGRVQGRDVETTRAPQQYGFDTVNALLGK